MEYHKTITLKDGRACTLRNGTAEDGRWQEVVLMRLDMDNGEELDNGI